MSNFHLSRSKYDVGDYDGKRLLVFKDEGCGYPYELSAWPLMTGTSFTVTATAVGIASHHVGKENKIAMHQIQIDEETASSIENPNSRFLNGQCDLVLFLNSPRRRARYTEPVMT